MVDTDAVLLRDKSALPAMVKATASVLLAVLLSMAPLLSFTVALLTAVPGAIASTVISMVSKSPVDMNVGLSTWLHRTVPAVSLQK